MFTNKSVVAAFVSFGLFATGCAAEQSEQTGSSDSEVRTQTFVDVKEGTFKLYDEPRSEPTDACDVHTVLTLTHDESGEFATLKDVVTGVCFLYVRPNERTFRLSWETNRCGVQTFSGETSVDGETHHIAITDNRRNLCNEKAQAEVVVDEYDQSGVVTTRYTKQ